MNWAVLVIWANGEQEYVKQGLSAEPARFTKTEANKQVDFWKMGFWEDEIQSVNIVRFPSKRRKKAA